MKTRRGKFAVSVLVFGSVLAIIVLAVLSLPPFGGTASGERLKLVQANPQYQDGAFVNVEPQSPYSLSEVGAMFSKQFFSQNDFTLLLSLFKIYPKSMQW